MTTRTAELAGTWYEADPVTLSRQIDGWLAARERRGGPGDPALLVVPHAGHMWSGAVAGAGFAAVKGAAIDRVFLLAPSHRYSFTGIAAPRRIDALETPMGSLDVDEDAAGAITAAGSPFVAADEPIAHEHAIEVELPFLLRALPEARIVPLVCGRLDAVAIERAGRVLFDQCDDATLIVVSSDLTHYGADYGYAPFGPLDVRSMARIKELDQRGLELIVERRVDDLLAYLDETGWTACGAIPAAVGLSATPPDAEGEVVEYTTSVDVSGDWTRSVSYAAVLLVTEMPRIPRPRRERLRRIAVRALLDVASGRRGAPSSDRPFGEAIEYGAFVTIKLDGRLRGCMGRPVSWEPLEDTVDAVARLAAASDPRFAPLTAAEVERCEVEISVLSRPRPVARPDDVCAGKDGVVLTWRGRRGLLLPQVAVEHRLGREEFLRAAADKAGIPWPLPPDARIEVFRATVF